MSLLMRPILTAFSLFVPVILIARPQISRTQHAVPVVRSVVDLPKSDFHPGTYGGRLKCFRGGFLRYRYDYALTDDHGQILAYLDTSELVLGTPLRELANQHVSVIGDPETRKYHGRLVVKVRVVTPIATR